MTKKRLGLAGALAVAVLGAVVLIAGIGLGYLAPSADAGRIRSIALPRDVIAGREQRQSLGRAAVADDKQILFGDLHVHTTFSSDAFLFSLPILQGEGAHPPADACDFARICSQLDFWSINDHAELLTPEQWRLTRESIRQCNAAAGDPANPDTVAFLGWEWTNSGKTAADHYGHKNVVFRGMEEDEVPARPIGDGQSGLAEVMFQLPLALRAALPLLGGAGDFDWYTQFNRFVRVARGTGECPEGVDVRDLPDDCFEYAATPQTLFEKLDQWGFDALVIPHGTSWGLTVPSGAEFAAQLAQHDPARQRLLEVFSGHGNSEVYRPWQAEVVGADGTPACPPPADDYLPCCWQAGEIVRGRCGDAPPAECERRVSAARKAFLDAGLDPLRFQTVPGTRAEDWGECGQLIGGFLPAYEYRPGMSAQAALAAGRDAAGEPQRFRFGLIGSSDSHTARPGTGYKQYAREVMTDAWGAGEMVLERMTEPVEPGAEALPLAELKKKLPPLQMLLPERGASFYYTGGLVAVHAGGRDRNAVFDALERREVYGTSGQRMLLWFDLLQPDRSIVPMGSEVHVDDAPRFRVRAVGAFEQLPGCPGFAREQLGDERLAALCRGECYNPGDRRHRIDRIEVVRIRPQRDAAEPIADLVEDPWRVFPCRSGRAGCVVEFADGDFVRDGRETVYYVRAIQEATPTINADPLRCERDAAGACVRSRPCFASGPRDAADDCLAPAEHRAWSSPIFVLPSAGGNG